MTIEIADTTQDVVAKIDIAELARHAAWLTKNANSARQPVPIMKTANVTISQDGIRLRAVDYEIWREAIIGPPPAAESPQLQVDAAQLASQTKKLKGTALITVRDNRLTIALPDRVLNITAAGEVSEWPEPPAYAPMNTMVLSVPVLKRAMVSIGTDETLPILSNMLVRNGQLSSTDRFRLTRETVGDETLSVLIPRDLLRLFAVGKTDIEVSTSETHVAMSRDGQTAITMPMSLTDYPKTDRLMDGAIDRSGTGIEIDRIALLAACGGDSVDIERHNESTITVTTSSFRSDDSSARVYVPADIGGEFPRIRVATKYLADALKVSAEARVQLWLGENGARPLLVRSGLTEHLVMPQRLPG